MHLSSSVLLPLSLFFSTISAHGIVETIYGGGQVWNGKNPWISDYSPGWSADNKDYGFVTDVTSINMTCHRNGTTGTQFIPVAAGSEVRLKWSGTAWPHPGPALTYLARCPTGNCLTATPGSLEFFKIAEAGLVKKFNNTVEGCYWGAYVIRDNGNTAVVKLPSNIKPGDYVLRHEIIALHAAFNVSGAQFYPQCVNLRVSGGDGTVVPSGVKATRLYRQTEPAVLTNIYYPVPTAYALPGPTIAAALKFDGVQASTSSDGVKAGKGGTKAGKHQRDMDAGEAKVGWMEDEETE